MTRMKACGFYGTPGPNREEWSNQTRIRIGSGSAAAHQSRLLRRARRPSGGRTRAAAAWPNLPDLDLITHPSPRAAKDLYSRTGMLWPLMCAAVRCVNVEPAVGREGRARVAAVQGYSSVGPGVTDRTQAAVPPALFHGRARESKASPPTVNVPVSGGVSPVSPGSPALVRPVSPGSLLPAVFQLLSEAVVALTMADVLRARAALLAALRVVDSSQPVPSPPRGLAGEPARPVAAGARRGRP